MTIAKVLVAALALAAPLAPALDAQSGSYGPRYGGLVLKGGLSYGDVSNGGVYPGGARTRSGAAIGLGLLSDGPLGFGVEALYAQRGIVGDPGSSRELDYIDVPIYLRLAAQNPAIEPFGYIGPQISVELKCDSNGGACPSGRDKVSYAGTIGGGVRLTGLGGLSIEGRYVYGLSDLQLGTVSDPESYRTRAFMMLFGFSF
jgi:hypothetical protein